MRIFLFIVVAVGVLALTVNSAGAATKAELDALGPAPSISASLEERRVFCAKLARVVYGDANVVPGASVPGGFRTDAESSQSNLYWHCVEDPPEALKAAFAGLKPARALSGPEL